MALPEKVFPLIVIGVIGHVVPVDELKVTTGGLIQPQLGIVTTMVAGKLVHPVAAIESTTV